MEQINILVTLDEKYLDPLKVMLTSLYWNNPKEKFCIWFMHSRISDEEMERLREDLIKIKMELNPVKVDEEFFSTAPTGTRYTYEMYYRLLAQHILPKSVERIIYLDPDILVINSIRPLWELDLQGKIYGAASHTGITDISHEVNKIRLSTDHRYFNSGVLLIDLKSAREKTSPKEVFEFVEKHKAELLLPDQDVLNGLYGSFVLEVEDIIWNYDARNYNTYFIRSISEADTQWIMENTVILHFCGKAKPWKSKYRYRFGVLYQHYMKKSSEYFQ